jgi:FkbM family methyltransferase
MNIEKLSRNFVEFQGTYTGQLKQDVLVKLLTKNKKHGYFVEFGTMDGKFASNTYILEKELGWTGILAEPGKKFHDELKRHRRCNIDYRAVTNRTGDTLKFQEMSTDEGMSGLVDFFDEKEMHYRRRANTPSVFYEVNTVSLLDLLTEYQAPQHIDYISVDTEGSEPAILEAFDFDQYQVDIWTVEHNFLESARNKIHDIMTRNGYVRIMELYSQYDDWYVKKELL